MGGLLVQSMIFREHINMKETFSLEQLPAVLKTPATLKRESIFTLKIPVEIHPDSVQQDINHVNCENDSHCKKDTVEQSLDTVYVTLDIFVLSSYRNVGYIEVFGHFLDETN